MPNKVERLLRERYEGFTIAERTIASWLLDNMASVPFETGASIGQRVGVSAMTVGRFFKSLGYASLSALKDDLRQGLGDAPWLLPSAVGPDPDARMKAETGAIADVYRLAQSPEWAAIVAMLVQARAIHVAGFQSERGLAAGFAHLLGYVRPDVHSLDAGSGLYAEILDATPADVIVLVDIRRYSRHFRLLAERATVAGLPVVVVTDPYCPWVRDLTPHILTAEVALGHFWDMNTALASLLNLLVDDVVRSIGTEKVHARLARLSDSYSDFIGFQQRVNSANTARAR